MRSTKPGEIECNDELCEFNSHEKSKRHATRIQRSTAEMTSRVGAEMFDDKESNWCSNFDRGSRCFDLSWVVYTCNQGVINLRLHEVVDSLTSLPEVCAARRFNRLAPVMLYTNFTGRKNSPCADPNTDQK